MRSILPQTNVLTLPPSTCSQTTFLPPVASPFVSTPTTPTSPSDASRGHSSRPSNGERPCCCCRRTNFDVMAYCPRCSTSRPRGLPRCSVTSARCAAPPSRVTASAAPLLRPLMVRLMPLCRRSLAPRRSLIIEVLAPTPSQRSSMSSSTSPRRGCRDSTASAIQIGPRSGTHRRQRGGRATARQCARRCRAGSLAARRQGCSTICAVNRRTHHITKDAFRPNLLSHATHST